MKQGYKATFYFAACLVAQEFGGWGMFGAVGNRDEQQSVETV